MKTILYLISITFLIHCNSSKIVNTKSKNYIEITFTSEKKLIIDNHTFEISIYGKNKDSNAKKDVYIFTDNTIQIQKLPFTLRVEIPNKAYLLLNPKSKKKDAIYYLSALCDNNNDERLKNRGDIMIDKSKGFPTISLKKNEENIIYLKLIE